MKAENVLFSYRNTVRAGLCILALGGFSLSHAETYTVSQGLENKADFQRFIQQSTGGAKVTVPYNATPVLTKGATGFTMSGGGMLGKTGTLINIGTKIPNGAILRGIRGLAGGPLGLAILAAPFVLDWMRDSEVGRNLDPFTRDQKPFLVPKGDKSYMCDATPEFVDGWRAWVTAQNGTYSYAAFIKVTTNCFYGANANIGVGGATVFVGYDTRPLKPVVVPQLEPADWDEAEPWFVGHTPSDNSISEILERGGNIVPGPTTVTGPATTTGPKTTSTSPDGKTVTTQQVTNNTYNDNKVTTTTTTTTVTNNNDGTPPETTTDTEENKPEEQDADLCKLHPEILACSKPELDTPDGEIPKDTKTITYQEENLFGAGSCPADVYVQLGTMHQSVKVWDWQKTCSFAVPLRALVVGLASFAAFLIVMPGSPRV